MIEHTTFSFPQSKHAPGLVKRSAYILALVLLNMPSTVWADQTLQQAFVQVYQTNPGLLAERARLCATDEKVSEALSDYRPRLDATANIGKRVENTNINGATIDNNLTPRSVGLELVQPIFRGFQTQAAVKSADKDVLAARANIKELEQRLLLDTGKAFLDIVQEQAVLDMMNNHEKLLEQQLSEAQDRLIAGMSTETDVRQAESRLEKIKADQIQVQGDLDSSRIAYARLLGEQPKNLVAPDLVLNNPQTQEELLSLAGTKNPRIIAAQSFLEKSRSEIERQRGALLPEVNLVGTTSRAWAQSNEMTGRNQSSQLMLQLRLPLYRGGADYARTRAAQHTSVQQRLVLEDTRRDVQATAVRSWSALLTAQAAIKARQAAIRAATLALNGVQEEQKAGTRTTLDVLNAEQELLDARVDLVRARHNKDMAILQIKAAVGDLTIDALKLSPDLYDPAKHYNEVRGQWVGFAPD